MSFDELHTGAETGMLGASGSVEDGGKQPKKLLNMSECKCTCPKHTEGGNPPRRPPDDPDDPSGEVNASGVSRCDEDARRRPKKLWNAPERVSAQLKQTEQEDSLSRPPDEPNAPDDEAVIPGDLQSTQGCPKGIWSECIEETNALCPHTGPGGYASELETRRGDEVDRAHQKVIEGAEYDGVCTINDWNARVIKTNAEHQVTGPGGHMGKWSELGSVGSDRECRNDGEHDGYDAERGQMDGAASGARYHSKTLSQNAIARCSQDESARTVQTRYDEHT